MGVGGEVHFRHNTKGRGGEGSCLSEEGEVPYMKGQLSDLLNSERFTIDYNNSEILIPEVQKSRGLKPPPPFPY